jgi:uncharacterized membrane protein YfcA
MDNSFIIALFFSLGFFFESIFGFGGGLIAYFFLGFFIDIKEMIMAGLYVATLASSYIAFSSRKYINFKIIINLMPVAIFGSIFGVFSFNFFSTQFLSLIFAFLLLFLSFKNFFQKNNLISQKTKNILLVTGSISQGIYGIGGPFIINAIKDKFANKHMLRANMAVYFLFCNIIRIIHLLVTKNLPFEFITNISWIIIPVFISIFFGYFIHMKIKDEYFKKGIGIITLIASLNFFYKACFG